MGGLPTADSIRIDRLGVVVNRVVGVDAVIDATLQAERLGFGGAWLTNGGPEDCMPLLAALAVRTSVIRLGTSVVQTYPRHPFVLATEANVVDQLAPGRLRLGVGPSHDLVMRGLGIERSAPLAHLVEYVSVIRSLVATGAVDHEGIHYRVRAGIGRSFAMPVMVGALQPRTFQMAGEAADGAITWLCPPAYLADHGVPALEQGAAAAGRDRPPLVAHVAACVHDDADQVREAVRRGIPNIAFPGYQRMLVTAGFDDAARGLWTDHLIDHVIAWGSSDAVAGRISEMFDAGADEVLIRPVGAGPDPEAVVARTVADIAMRFR
jgi:F420-dependent oxidoreductase-like protein